MKTEPCLSAAMKTGPAYTGSPLDPPLDPPESAPEKPCNTCCRPLAGCRARDRSSRRARSSATIFFILRSLPLALQMSNVVNDMDEPLPPDSQAYVDELQPVQGVAHTTLVLRSYTTMKAL